jgi:hypothetical protein
MAWPYIDDTEPIEGEQTDDSVDLNEFDPIPTGISPMLAAHGGGGYSYSRRGSNPTRLSIASCKTKPRNWGPMPY